MTFEFLPHIPSKMYKHVFLKHICLGFVGFFMLMTVTSLHYILTADDYCKSGPYVNFVFRFFDFFCMLFHWVAFICSFIVIPGILLDLPIFVVLFMMAYVWWALLQVLGNSIRIVGACIYGNANFGSLILQVIGYILPSIYILGASYLNTYAESIEA